MRPFSEYLSWLLRGTEVMLPNGSFGEIASMSVGWVQVECADGILRWFKNSELSVKEIEYEVNF